jgi:hypothetical protein
MGLVSTAFWFIAIIIPATRLPTGMAFQSSNFTWTVSLCLSDSDGDGATNGEVRRAYSGVGIAALATSFPWQELGDACCVWKPGAVPAFTSGITDPSIPDTLLRPRSCTTSDYTSLKANIAVVSSAYFSCLPPHPEDDPLVPGASNPVPQSVACSSAPPVLAEAPANDEPSGPTVSDTASPLLSLPVAPAPPPPGCTPSTKGLSCMQPLLGSSLVLHWTVEDTAINFLVQAKNSRWVAFGPGSSMVGSQVVIGNLDGDAAPAVYILGGYSPNDVKKASAQSSQLVLSAAAVQSVNGETLLSFAMPASPSRRRRSQQSFIAAFGSSM